MSAYEAQRLIHRRIQDFEDNGMLILQSQEDLPLYTNMIRGLVDRFIHRNPRINLLQIRPHMDPPSPDPYLFPHLYVPFQINSDSSSDEFYDTSPELPPLHNPHSYQYLSAENIQHYPTHSHDQSLPLHHTEPVTPATHHVRLSPGRRFGSSADTCASFTPHSQHKQLDIDLNIPPTNFETPSNPPTNLDPSHSTTHANPSSNPQPSRIRLLQQLSDNNWAHGALRIINGFCIPVGPLNRERSQPSPPSKSIVRPERGSLASLVAQGWAIQPPGPMEAGPSNWVERDLQINSHFEEADHAQHSPPELRSISNIINNLFRISPPIFADVFNPLLQEQNIQATDQEH